MRQRNAARPPHRSLSQLPVANAACPSAFTVEHAAADSIAIAEGRRAHACRAVSQRGAAAAGGGADADRHARSDQLHRDSHSTAALATRCCSESHQSAVADLVSCSTVCSPRRRVGRRGERSRAAESRGRADAAIRSAALAAWTSVRWSCCCVVELMCTNALRCVVRVAARGRAAVAAR